MRQSISMYMNMYIKMSICACVYVCLCFVCVGLYAYVYVYAYAYVYVYASAYVYVYICVGLNAYVYAHMYMYTHVYYMSTSTNICMHTSRRVCKRIGVFKSPSSSPWTRLGPVPTATGSWSRKTRETVLLQIKFPWRVASVARAPFRRFYSSQEIQPRSASGVLGYLD